MARKTIYEHWEEDGILQDKLAIVRQARLRHKASLRQCASLLGVSYSAFCSLVTNNYNFYCAYHQSYQSYVADCLSKKIQIEEELWREGNRDALLAMVTKVVEDNKELLVQGLVDEVDFKFGKEGLKDIKEGKVTDNIIKSNDLAKDDKSSAKGVKFTLSIDGCDLDV